MDNKNLREMLNGTTSILNNARILLAPTIDLAEDVKAQNQTGLATVEAEYGDFCIEGSDDLGGWKTLAHHGSRSSNPAPCIWEFEGQHASQIVPQVILISHLDLDSLGGILRLLGFYVEEDEEFWKAAAFIDVAGPHHIREVSEDAQKKLKAFWAMNERGFKNRLPRDRVSDVTGTVLDFFGGLARILGNDPEMIQEGERWDKEVTQAVQNCLVRETPFMRVFCGPLFTASSYCGEDGVIRPCTISMNTKTRALTLAFEDGGKEFNACKIMQEVFGEKAGGRHGIAGTPRGETFDLLQLVKLVNHVETLLDPNEFENYKEMVRLRMRWPIEYVGENRC